MGDLDVRKVHDDTLRPFVDARLIEGVSPITINRTLEIARAILNRAARAYRDADGFPWLETAPPLITMLPESPRLPHPINWEEQDRTFRHYPTILPGWRCKSAGKKRCATLGCGSRVAQKSRRQAEDLVLRS